MGRFVSRARPGSRAGFARLSRYFSAMGGWRDRAEWKEIVHNDLVNQMREQRRDIPVSKRPGTRKWGGQTISAGVSMEALTNPNHPLHVFTVFKTSIRFGANTPGALFNTKGTMPPVDFVRVQRVITVSIVVFANQAAGRVGRAISRVARVRSGRRRAA